MKFDFMKTRFCVAAIGALFAIGAGLAADFGMTGLCWALGILAFLFIGWASEA